MRSKTKPIVSVLTFFIILSGLCSCRTSTTPAILPETRKAELPTAREELKTKDRQVAEIQKKIAEAVEEAKRTGKTKVNVYLDENPDVVQTGDLVDLTYSAALEDGRVISGNGNSFGKVTRTIVSGRPARIPGLGTAVLGMTDKEKKKAVIEPEQAYGVKKAEEQKEYPRLRQIPILVEMEKALFQERFKSLPARGEKVQINPYFPSEVMDLTDTRIVLKNLAQDGQTETAPFGKTLVKINQNMITIALDPVIGAPFIAGKKQGTIISADDKKFVVDFNHPYAGKKIILNMEVNSFIKASVHQNMEIMWIDDHGKGAEIAGLKKKNKVLVLYADWCQWCKKLFEETFTDPRIKLLKDEFVWVKANSDRDPDLKSLYQQDGFPMIVLTDFKGNIIREMEGYKDAETMLSELDQMMKSSTVNADN